MSFLKRFFRKTPPRDRIAREEIDLSPPGVEGNASYHNIDFVDCDFTMSDRWPQFLTNCTFETCRFDLSKSLRGFQTRNSTFRNCNFHFCRATKWEAIRGERFEDCRFTGRLSGARFGCEDNDDPNLPHRQGFITRCDFSQLELDNTEFQGDDPSANCQFPDWPVVRLTHRSKTVPQVIADLPKAFHDKMLTDTHRLPLVTTYVCNLSETGLNEGLIRLVAAKTDILKIG